MTLQAALNLAGVVVTIVCLWGGAYYVLFYRPADWELEDIVSVLDPDWPGNTP